MPRSLWKGPFIDFNILKELKLKKKFYKIYYKNSTILPNFIGFTFLIYNGQKYISLKIKPEMVGYKFGEFILTRKAFRYKKK